MNFLRRYKKAISTFFIVLSVSLIFTCYLKDFYINAYSRENSFEYNSVTKTNEMEKEALNINSAKPVIKTAKVETKPAAKPTVKSTAKTASQNKSVSITRKNYKNGMMTISIPKIKVNTGVVSGTSKQALKKGPGLYENSPLPGGKDVNVCIAAHRNAYGQWFRNVDKLKSGDEISLTLGNIKYIYKIEKVFIVENDDWSITNKTGYSAITLTSCYPLKPPYKRIVVRGKLKEKKEVNKK